MLAEAGATVLKVERPGTGDIARLGAGPGEENVDFAVLNRGKRSVTLDLKAPEGVAAARRLAVEADVVVEQFRPGVMERLGLGYDTLRAVNPRLIYCSITGFGQQGALAHRAGHDLNYAARAGLLDVVADSVGEPVLPPTQVADIGGGSFPAVLNILLALRQRDLTGEGSYLDISMMDNVFTWMRRPMARALSGGRPYPRGSLPNAGGWARYNIYATADGRHLSVAAIEEPFWQRLCELVGLPVELRPNDRSAEAKERLKSLFAARTGAEWMRLFEGEDVCVELVLDASEAVQAARDAGSTAFDAELRMHAGMTLPALPVPVAASFRRPGPAGYPKLQAANHAATWEDA
jgi:crotonobetainyl-CoA:carnitine CoA-transferase CaiB-like acyl-CoA transferase